MAAVAEKCGEVTITEESALSRDPSALNAGSQDELQLYVEGDTGHCRARVKGECKTHVDVPRAVETSVGSQDSGPMNVQTLRNEAAAGIACEYSQSSTSNGLEFIGDSGA